MGEVWMIFLLYLYIPVWVVILTISYCRYARDDPNEFVDVIPVSKESFCCPYCDRVCVYMSLPICIWCVRCGCKSGGFHCVVWDRVSFCLPFCHYFLLCRVVYGGTCDCFMCLGQIVVQVTACVRLRVVGKLNPNCTASSCLVVFWIFWRMRVVIYVIAYVTSHDCAVYLFVLGTDVLFSFKVRGQGD